MIQPGSMLDRYVRLTLQIAGDANPQDAEMKQPQLIPKRRKRKLQPTASMYREQLRLAADRIIELERVIDTTKRLMGWDRPPMVHRPWYRRLWNRLRVRVVETDKRTAAEQVAVMEER